MNGKTILTGIAAFATTMAFGLAAQADEYRWTNGASTGDWSTAGNWYNRTAGGVSGFPDDANDTAAFDSAAGSNPSPNPSSVSLSANVIAGHIEVVNSTVVTISASSSRKTLNLTAGDADGILLVDSTANASLSLGQYVTLALNSAVTHQIGGIVALTSQASNEPFIDVNANVTFGPYSGTYGMIKGEDAAAQIRIVANSTLTNQITLQGMMEVLAQSGTATLANDRVNASAASGLVLANVAGVFKLNANLILDDNTNSGSYLPVWKASVSSSATLQFDRAATTLIGDFSLLNCADFVVNADVHTSGGLLNFVGCIDATGGRFRTDSTQSVDINGTSSCSGGC